MARLFFLLPVCLLLHDQHANVRDVLCATSTKMAPAQDPEAISRLVKNDPLTFMQMSIDRYLREVQGYSCFFCKRERVNGKLRAREEIDVVFRERPHSVYMQWRKGATSAQKVVFVKGENDDCLLALPAGLLSIAGVQVRSLDHPASKNSGRYLISDFGIKLGCERALRDMRRAGKAGTLRVHSEGDSAVPELDNQRCYKLVRDIDPAEEDGVRKAVFFFDTDTWLQTGTILYDVDNNLIAEYFFKDLHFNPQFTPQQFTQSAL